MLENEIFCLIKTRRALNIAPTADYDLCLGPYQGPENFPSQISMVKMTIFDKKAPSKYSSQPF
jgi:hypothetical protein